MARINRRGLHYLAGGNPPYLPGLYLDGKIIAIWPIEIEPTEDRCLNIFRLYEANQTCFGRDQIRDELEVVGLRDCNGPDDGGKLVIY